MYKKNLTTDRRVYKSKQALKEAVLTLMKSTDFTNITITDIVQLADLNRGTFYKHYETKEEIFDEIIEDVIADLTDSYREPYKSIEVFDLNKLAPSSIKVFNHVEKYKNFYNLILHSNKLAGFQHKICNVLKELALKDLIDLHKNSSIDSEIQASYHAYAIFGMIVEWVNSDFKYSADFMANQLFHLIMVKHSDSVYKIQ
ncbi:TetR family transcriptional regulator OS=Ureibacillus acetophenoni OX=614649 GN=SAMN05877842_11483 PE=4 SV=1 [Ureibacillus acetophenoni]